MSAVLGTETWPTYVDVQDQVKPWLQWQGVDTSHDFALATITDAVCTEAQKFAGGPLGEMTFGPVDGIGRFDGSGGLNSGYIMLPRLPVIQVVSVVEYQGSSPVALSEVTPESGGDGYQINYRTGRITRVLGGIYNRPFYPGSNNVYVTWKAGYNPVPADITWATLDWITHVFRNTQQTVTSKPGYGYAQEAEPASNTVGLWAGIPNRILTVLEQYQRVGVV